MVKNKNFKMSKRLLLVLGITLLATTSAYAYTKHEFNKDNIYKTSLDQIKNNITNLTTSLTNTAAKLKTEKDTHSSDISTLNGEVNEASKYAESVSSAVADADKTNSTASSAISKAESTISYDPSTGTSTVSSSAN